MRSSWVVLGALLWGCAPPASVGSGTPPVGGGGVYPGASGGDAVAPPPGPPAPTQQGQSAVSITGQIVDFADASPLSYATLEAFSGWPPPHVVMLDGGKFLVEDILANATVTLIVKADGHLPTTALPVAPGAHDVSDLSLTAIPSTFISNLQTQLGVTVAANTGAVLVKLTDAQGQPLDSSSVSAASLTLDVVAQGPFLIDGSQAVFFGVPPGRFNVQSSNGALSVAGNAAVVAAGGVAMVNAVVVPLQ